MWRNIKTLFNVQVSHWWTICRQRHTDDVMAAIRRELETDLAKMSIPDDLKQEPRAFPVELGG